MNALGALVTMVGLDALVAKAAVPAVVRALGWAGGRVVQRSRDQRLIHKVQDEVEQGTSVTLESIESSADVVLALVAFMKSAELEHLAHQFVLSSYLTTCEKTYPKELLRGQLRSLLRLHVTHEEDLLDTLESLIFDKLEVAATASRSILLGNTDSLPVRTRASIVKAAASYAAALARNSDMLKELETIADLQKFEGILRSQIESLHSTMRLPHSNSSRTVRYERLFVQPRIVFGVEDEPLELSDYREVLRHSARTVILGDPGGGKSTSSLKLTYDLARSDSQYMNVRVPFYVVLRDYAAVFQKDRTSLLEYLERLCTAPYAVTPPKGAIEYLLLNGASAVVFDGLDELLDTSQRRDIVQAVEGFSHRFPTSPVLVTSRRVGYDEAALDSDLFSVASLENFEPAQVENYARKWFSLDTSIQSDQRSALAECFLLDSRYVEDLRVNPLMLSLMCGLYSGERYIPKNRPEVYEKCALLLFERWDRQRGIVAPLPFDAHVMSSLRSLALWLYPKQAQGSGLPREELIMFMADYLKKRRFDDADEAENAANDFIDFCKGRAWVLTDVGAERYWFTHQTFLEFFAASQLVRKHTSAPGLLEQLWSRIANAEWDVVAQLALQTLGRSVEDGADDFLDKLLDRVVTLDSASQRTNVLSFAARALAFIVPRPAVLRKLVQACVSWASQGEMSETVGFGSERAMLELADCTPENRPLTMKYLKEAIVSDAETAKNQERALTLSMFWSSYRRRRGSRGNAAVFGTASDDYNVTVDLVREVSPLIRSMATRRGWAAAYLAEDGKVSVADVVSRFGMGAFYECEFAGAVIDPPLVWKVISSVGRGEVLAWRNPKGRELTLGLVRDLYEAALTAESPWLQPSATYKPLFGADLGMVERSEPLELNPSRQVMLSSAVVLLLPILELELMMHPIYAQRIDSPSSIKAKSTGRRLSLFVERWEGRRPARGKRRAPGKSADVMSELESAGVSSDARRLLRRWSDGGLSFVAEDVVDEPLS